jgi:hypothetical protein
MLFAIGAPFTVRSTCEFAVKPCARTSTPSACGFFADPAVT